MKRPRVTIDGKTGKPETPPRLVRVRPVKLDGMRSIRDEMARVYREARSGKIETQDATRLVFMLDKLREMTVAIEFEERITKLEVQEDEIDAIED
ncbi:MAG TPA: hypothetical protein PK981_04015 [Accumulibacter sp.]|nr:hypothetical protein [Accumulibacter sp.]HNN45910.1 hypothetical protein [Azospira sp.]HMW17743.1 hypothetical protein [Accumulibacter sp.]HMX21625.1 hypothetical protein [Accumulibacter sp.]HNG38199.1 hypothetical protein [Accumulibacter sp.]